jgi:hypothetical protein
MKLFQNRGVAIAGWIHYVVLDLFLGIIANIDWSNEINDPITDTCRMLDRSRCSYNRTSSSPNSTLLGPSFLLSTPWIGLLLGNQSGDDEGMVNPVFIPSGGGTPSRSMAW